MVKTPPPKKGRPPKRKRLPDKTKREWRLSRELKIKREFQSSHRTYIETRNGDFFVRMKFDQFYPAKNSEPEKKIRFKKKGKIKALGQGT